MKKWYSIQSSAQSGAPAKISIHDEIGAWGVTARDFIRDFDSLPQDSNIELSVHSPGGSVFEALAIYHVLNRAKDRITARVEGLAASAASLIVMAASLSFQFRPKAALTSMEWFRPSKTFSAAQRSSPISYAAQYQRNSCLRSVLLFSK